MFTILVHTAVVGHFLALDLPRSIGIRHTLTCAGPATRTPTQIVQTTRPLLPTVDATSHNDPIAWAVVQQHNQFVVMLLCTSLRTPNIALVLVREQRIVFAALTVLGFHLPAIYRQASTIPCAPMACTACLFTFLCFLHDVLRFVVRLHSTHHAFREQIVLPYIPARGIRGFSHAQPCVPQNTLNAVA
ncbi:hypothetical protein BP20092_00945 [Bifidobacterium pseudolongum subsp. globosum DSM 20092]|nr:hypothetical protein BP20092_00945 [Bifidobacterium pseudolongum subsp. globosum DSM 20092]